MRSANLLAAFSETDDELRSPRKRKAILRASAEVFLRNGYLGTSVDEVAGVAGVSKQTVYKHFSDKESLFRELIVILVASAADTVEAGMQNFDFDGNIESSLFDLAVRQLEIVMTPAIIQLRRLVIGEVSRFPALAKTFYEDGPARTIDSLTALFERLSIRGYLNIDDARVAAAQFNWLVMSSPLNRALFLGDDAIPTGKALRKDAEQGVRMFLAAYRAKAA
ncbi:TetR/AcrR family transcriptional regulator [Sphingomonas sp. QA11]|uniref:TetR/AcrR family transcriptional regulator n=1 Tax=Sphingomonas sp. QA11 TaxID=2950605 RepID=UPI002349D7DF|nr:TetR/AcrR family transcriptional regulator [Sphingomonas sp. QA11]WCM27382.1 TetR/AcrR family transcriptional regulator [Sphingomonas sp. QA11]